MKRKDPPTKTYKTAAKKQKTNNILVQQNTVRRGAEKKNIDVAQVLTMPVATGTASVSNFLTPIVQGITDNERIGRKVRLVKFSLRWNAYLASTTTVGSPFRVKVVYDKQCNGQALTAASVMTVDSMISANNLDNADRFITLCDFYTRRLSQPSQLNDSGFLQRKIDLNQLWGGVTGGIADLNTGAVYLLAWSNGQIATQAASFSYYCRFRYTDN